MKKAGVILSLCAGALFAQSSGANTAKADATAQANKDTRKNAASSGAPVPAQINVADNLNIEAVLLPFDVAKSVFGSEVARDYAVIEINISNRSNDAGLIVQSLLIDITNWGFAGATGLGPAARGISRAQQSKPYQSASDPLEVASVEYRIVRGQLLDQQPWTARNLGMRTIQALGSIGVAFAFPFSKDVVNGIAGWNGAVIPAYQAMFPDGLQAQLDRVSDYGFRNNKVIPQQAADILVAFFPINRLLTPGLGYAFLKAPAVFFNPILIALDPDARKKVEPIIKSAFKDPKTEFQNMLEVYTNASTLEMQYNRDLQNIAEAQDAVNVAQAVLAQDAADVVDVLKKQHQQAVENAQARQASSESQRDMDKQALDGAMQKLASVPLYGLLARLSLNNVEVKVSGIMTVDVDNVPAIITSLECARAGDTSPTIWAQAGDLTCTLHGSFLSNGTPAVAEASALGLTVRTIATGSTDAVLNFKLTLSKPLDPKTVLTFTVTKKNKQGNAVESAKFLYTLPDYSLPAPTIAQVDLARAVP